MPKIPNEPKRQTTIEVTPDEGETVTTHTEVETEVSRPDDDEQVESD